MTDKDMFEDIRVGDTVLVRWYERSPRTFHAYLFYLPVKVSRVTKTQFAVTRGSDGEYKFSKKNGRLVGSCSSSMLSMEGVDVAIPADSSDKDDRQALNEFREKVNLYRRTKNYIKVDMQKIPLDSVSLEDMKELHNKVSEAALLMKHFNEKR